MELEVRLHVGQGTHRGPLTVFPVWTDRPSSDRGYLTGAAAPVEVAERAGSPAVGQVVVTNRADRPVLLLAGELLEGGMQHRALTRTTLLRTDRRCCRSSTSSRVAGTGTSSTGGRPAASRSPSSPGSTRRPRCGGG